MRNSSNDTLNLDSWSPSLSFVELWLSTVVVLAATLVSLISNTLALVLTCVWGARSRFHTVFIANLAVADLLSSIVASAHWLLLVELVLPTNGLLMVLNTASHTLQAASAAAVVSITLDRLCLACRPIRYHLRDGTSGACGWVVFVWIVSFVMHIPLLLVCNMTRQLFMVFYGILECTVPLIILTISNCTIYHQIFRNRQLRNLRRHSGQPRFDLSADGGASLRTSTDRDSLRHMAFLGASRNGRRKFSLPSMTVQNVLLTNSTAGGGGSQTSTLCNRRRLSSVSIFSRQRDSEELLNQLLQRQHKRALRTLVFIVFLFAVCRLPYSMAHLVCWSQSHFYPATASCDAKRLQSYSSLLLLLNAALDPLVYALWGNQLYQDKLLSKIEELVTFIEEMRCCGLTVDTKRTVVEDEDVKLESRPLVPV